MPSRDDYVRQLEDAALTLWWDYDHLSLRDEFPRLAEFLAHLHHKIEHEQAMVRQNVWAEPHSVVDPFRQAQISQATQTDMDS